MCGRYAVHSLASVAQTFGHAGKQAVQSMQERGRWPSYNVSPMTPIPVFTQATGSDPTPTEPTFQVNITQWGYSPSWADKPMNLINARVETLNAKPSFREAARCVMVADGWYEWQQGTSAKQPYYHKSQKGSLLLFAGIFNDHGACIVTREAAEDLANIHHRQPLLLSTETMVEWLSSHSTPGTFVAEDQPKIEAYPVSQRVNKPAHNDPSLLQRVEPFSGDLFL
ncbi:MAG: SOS response-associated peptidase [Balneolaceae bacterium]|nr:SOS response-associated peptidase [Balneolaceae bacterium]